MAYVVLFWPTITITISINIMISSYNETLSGETLSSMSEKSDSYFTTELDSR